MYEKILSPVGIYIIAIWRWLSILLDSCQLSESRWSRLAEFLTIKFGCPSFISKTLMYECKKKKMVFIKHGQFSSSVKIESSIKTNLTLVLIFILTPTWFEIATMYWHFPLRRKLVVLPAGIQAECVNHKCTGNILRCSKQWDFSVHLCKEA